MKLFAVVYFIAATLVSVLAQAPATSDVGLLAGAPNRIDQLHELTEVAGAGQTVARPTTNAGAAPRAAASQPATYYVSLSGSYTDCTGRTPLPVGFYRDTCFPGLYIVAHTPGPGVAFYGYSPGTRLVVAGRVYTVRNYFYTASSRTDYGVAPLTLRTCANATGTRDLMVEAW